jgi:hypothetical protein
LPAEHLSRLACDVSQPSEHRSSSRQQSILPSRGCQLAKSWTEHEPALQIPADQTMMLEGDGKPVGSRPGEPSRGDETSQGGRPGFQGTEH